MQPTLNGISSKYAPRSIEERLIENLPWPVFNDWHEVMQDPARDFGSIADKQRLLLQFLERSLSPATLRRVLFGYDLGKTSS